MKRAYHLLFNYFVCCFLLCNLTAFSNTTNTLVTTSTPYNITDTAATVDIDVTASTTINIPNHELTNLTPNTVYEIKFRADAQNLDDNTTTAETNTQTFTTQQIKAYVDINNTTGNNDGNSWETAYTNLQDAIYNTETNGEIWVAAGTYLPTFTPDSVSMDKRHYTFHIKRNLKIYGGFAGTETSLDQRTLENKTILSGDLGIVNDNTDNAYHVLITANLDNNAIIDGFTIINGNGNTGGTINYASIDFSNNAGGGMYNSNSSPLLTNIEFNNNTANSGGGMINLNSNPSITNSSFTNNTASGNDLGAGGMLNIESSPVLNNITFTNNSAPRGGAMVNFSSFPNINTTTFIGNTAEIEGGAMANSDAFPTITNSMFTNNSSNRAGAMLNLAMSSPNINNTTFINNTAESEGGAIFNINNSSPTINNSMFTNNIGKAAGGGIFNTENSTPLIINTTFSNNQANKGAGMNNNSSTPEIMNCVFRNNIANNTGGGIYNSENSNPRIINTTFSNNQATIGGGMGNNSSTPEIMNCLFNNNIGNSNGGGISNSENSNPRIINTIFQSNEAGSGGGMGNSNNSAPTITNTLFINNIAGDNGGAMVNFSNSSPTIKSTTFFNNSVTKDTFNNNGGGAIYTFNASSSIINSVFYLNMANGTLNNLNIMNAIGNNNASDVNDVLGISVSLTEDPFSNSDDADGTDDTFGTADDGLLPKNGSVLINAGNNLLNDETNDITDGARIKGDDIDIGAYEALLPTKTYVNRNATGNNDGSSWQDAYTNLQNGISNTSTNGEIWVTVGDYFPSKSPDSESTDSRNFAFHFNRNLKIYGGFTGTETSLSERNTDNKTTLNGNLNNPNSNDDNAYHVLITAFLDNTTIIDGFIITNGHANGDDSINYDNSIINNEFPYTQKNGGGMFNYRSSPTINNVIFNNNIAEESGGGMENFASSPIVQNTIFNNNITNRWGGGMHNSFLAAPTINNTTFSNNTASNGGGIMNNDVTDVVINNTVFINNAASLGGGMYNHTGNPKTTNTVFINNKANTGEGLGGGLYSTANALLINTTFINNTAIGQGAGVFTNPSITIQNTVFYQNTVNNTINDIETFQGEAEATGGNNNASDGDGNEYGIIINLTSDPFVNSEDPDGADDIFGTADDGLALKPNAPLINAGDSTLNIETYDIAGNRRIEGDAIEIGAYEGLLPLKTYVNRNVIGGNNNGTSWANAYNNLQEAIDNTSTNGEIWVTTGNYFPTASPENMSTTARDFAFHLNRNLKLYGGFLGTETTLEERSAENKTTLNGNLDQNNTNNNNAFHVLITVNLDNTSIIDGFTITNGNANGNSSNNMKAINYIGHNIFNNLGSGMFNIASSPNINNLVFTNNTGDTASAIYNTENSSPNITNTSIINNITIVFGGAIHNYASSPSITNTIFANNTTSDRGAAITNQNSSPTITNTIFVNNTATTGGGAMFNFNNSSPIIQNTVFYQNTINNNIIEDIENTESTSTGSNNASDDINSVIVTVNLTTDPFINSDDLDGLDNIFGTEDDGIALSANSALINAGDNTFNNEAFDITGNTRINDTSIDIGPYEYQGATLSPDAIINTTETSIYQSQKNELTFKDANLEEISSLEIYNISGKQLINKKVQLSDYNNKVIITSLSKGFYIVRVVTLSGQSTSKKIILY